MALKNKDEYNAYMKQYMLKRYHERRNKALELLGEVCKKCGEQGEEFDHIDRSTKSFDIGKKWNVSEEKYFEEIAKCQLLCKKCHLEKSFESKDFSGHGKSKCGTSTKYIRHKCRCHSCVEAYKKASKRWKKKKLPV